MTVYEFLTYCVVVYWVAYFVGWLTGLSAHIAKKLRKDYCECVDRGDYE